MDWKKVGLKTPASWSKILEALDYNGITYGKRLFIQKERSTNSRSAVYSIMMSLFCGTKDLTRK